METTSDNNQARKTGGSRRFRMAYALNNRQPVRCTIISDQPLFYMDFESDIEDDMEFDLSASVSMPSPVVQDKENKERQERALSNFLSDATLITGHTAGVAGHDNEFELAILARTLAKSRLAAAFLDCMARHGGKMVLNDQVETAFYDRVSGSIHLNPNLPRAEQVLLAARELRRLWQHRNGAMIDPLTFHPDQAVLINRAQIADTASSMVRIAWELQLAGEKECWARIENSQMNDLARAFAREAFMDFRTVGNGTACCAVFEAWFLSDRCGHEDRSLIQSMLADGQNYAFDAESSSKTVTAEVIAALGSMPFGKNYLSPYITTIISDALFTEVRDRSNANFLWFIKFERSFREAERDLQTVEDQSSGVRQDSSRKKQKRFGDHEKTAEIIALPRGTADAPMEQSPSCAAGAGARIIQFRGSLHGARLGDR